MLVLASSCLEELEHNLKPERNQVPFLHPRCVISFPICLSSKFCSYLLLHPALGFIYSVILIPFVIPGCPVILPDRVVQALNLNLEAMDAATRPQSQVQTRCHNENVFTPAAEYRNNMASAVATSQQRRNQRTQPASAMLPQELQLPQEWTY